MNPLHRMTPSLTTRLSHIPSSETSSFQNQIDSLITSFLEQASDEKTLIAMVAGGMAYRLGKTAVMALNGGAYSSTPLRLASVGFGLASEVTAFELTSRALNTLSRSGLKPAPTNHLWSWSGPQGWKRGFFTSSVTFGLLKAAGPLAQGQNILLQHLFQDSALVAGHAVLETIGGAPNQGGTIAEQFVHAEAMNLQMLGGMGLAHGLIPALASLEKEWDLSLHSKLSDPLRKETFFGFFVSPFEMATATGANDPLKKLTPEAPQEKPLLVMMSREEGKRNLFGKIKQFLSRWVSQKPVAAPSPEKAQFKRDRIASIKNRNHQEKGPYRSEMGVTLSEISELHQYSQSPDSQLRTAAQEAMQTLNIAALHFSLEETRESVEAFCHLAEAGNLGAAQMLFQKASSNPRFLIFLGKMEDQHPAAKKVLGEVFQRSPSFHSMPLNDEGQNPSMERNKTHTPMFPEWVRGGLQKIFSSMVAENDQHSHFYWDTKASFYAALGYAQKLLGRTQEAERLFDLAKEVVNEESYERPRAYGASYGDAYEEIETLRNGLWPKFSFGHEEALTHQISESLLRKDWSTVFHFVKSYPDAYRQAIALAYLTKVLSESVDSLNADWQSRGLQEFPRLLMKGDPLPSSGEIWEVKYIDFQEERTDSLILTHGEEILSGRQLKSIEGNRRISVPKAFGWIFHPGDRIVLPPACSCCL